MVIIWPSMTWMIWGSPWTWLMLPCQCSQVFLRKLRRWGSWYRFDGEEMAPALCHHIAIIVPSLCHQIWSNLRSCSCWKASGRTFESSWMHWHDCGRTADLSTNFTRPFPLCFGHAVDGKKSPRSWTVWMMGPHPCPCLPQWKRWHPGYCWLPRCRRSMAQLFADL